MWCFRRKSGGKGPESIWSVTRRRAARAGSLGTKNHAAYVATTAAYIETRPRNLVAAIPFCEDFTRDSQVRQSDFSFPPTFSRGASEDPGGSPFLPGGLVTREEVAERIIVQGCDLRCQ
jgi:hypothetical protein